MQFAIIQDTYSHLQLTQPFSSIICKHNVYFCFFVHCVYIKFASPQAAQLSLNIFWKFENQQCCISTRDLFKDAPLVFRSRKGKRKEKKRRKNQLGIKLGASRSDVPLELPPQPQNCKHNVRWQHLPQIKIGSFFFKKLLWSNDQCSMLSNGTSSAIYS